MANFNTPNVHKKAKGKPSRLGGWLIVFGTQLEILLFDASNAEKEIDPFAICL